MNPSLLVILPLGLAALTYALGPRERLGSLLAAAGLLGDILLLLRLPEGKPFLALGRPLVLSLLDRAFLLPLVSLTILVLVYTWQVPQGQLFTPSVLTALGLVQGALVVETFPISVLMAESGFLVLGFLLGGRTEGSRPASLQFLSLLAMAGAALLAASELIGEHALNPASLHLVRLTSIFLTIGSGIILGAVPFHSWLGALSASARPMLVLVAVSYMSVFAVSMLLDLENRHTWLCTAGRLPAALVAIGTATALVGGLLSLTQKRPGPLVGYAAMCEMGFILFGLGSLSAIGMAAALYHLASRSLALALAAVGLEWLPEGGASQTRAGYTRLAALAFFAGGLAMSSFPLSPSFVSRWSILQVAFGKGQALGFILMASSLAVLVGYLRLLRCTVFGEGWPERGSTTPPLVVLAVVGALLGAYLVLCFYAQVPLRTLLRLVEGLRCLAPKA